MSKIVIRNGMSETNSSSVHSICISKKPVDNVRGRTLNFYLGEYHWGHESVDTKDYLYTAIMCQDEREELLNKLKFILDKHGVNYTFEPAKIEIYGVARQSVKVQGKEVEELQLYLRCINCNKEKTIKFVNSGIELIPKEQNEI